MVRFEMITETITTYHILHLNYEMFFGAVNPWAGISKQDPIFANDYPDQNCIVVINQRFKKRFSFHHVPPARATKKNPKIGNKKN